MITATRATCPRCGQECWLFGHRRVLSEHKTDQLVPHQHPGGRVRERCAYAGGTYADAVAHISPLRRKMIDELESHW